MSDDLASQIVSILEKYTDEIEEGLKKDIEDVAKEATQQLKSKSPKRTGKYAAGWGQSKTKDGITLHNKKKANLTHLLEKGHVSRNGGRVKPIKHIEPVEEWVQNELVRRTEKRLK